jgi:hypothetical protein
LAILVPRVSGTDFILLDSFLEASAPGFFFAFYEHDYVDV